MYIRLLATAAFFFILSFNVLAQSTVNARVIINEIAWMGSPPEPGESSRAAANDEWIEIYNAGEQKINLAGWALKSQDGKPDTSLTGAIEAGGYLLLSRNNQKVKGITADIVYPYGSNALSNSGEYLRLVTASGAVVDSVDASGGWPAGDNETKQTMERATPASNNWQSSAGPGGTPKARNSVYHKLSNKTQEQNATDTATSSKDATTTTEDVGSPTSYIYPKNIFINEIMPSPEGPDAEQEWVELYNQNNKTVNLSGWEIKDTAGSTKSYKIPYNTKVAPYNYLLLERPNTKITLNNQGDGLLLLRPDGKAAHQTIFNKAPAGQSYALTKTGFRWTQTPTPGKKNQITQYQKNQNTESASNNQRSYENLNKATAQQLSAQLNQKSTADKLKSVFKPLTIGFLAALAAAATILFTKKKLEED